MYDTITNHAEFFSDHYLEALLGKDLHDLRRRWDEAEGRDEETARTAIRAARATWFEARAATREAGTTGDALAQRRLNDVALAALRFEPAREDVHLTRGEVESVAIRAAATVRLPTGLHLLALDLGFADDVDDVFDPDGAGRLLDPVGVDGDDAIVDPAAAAQLLFSCDDPPRHVLLVAGPTLLLADRTKWAEGRYLAVDLDTAMDRNDAKELDTVAGNQKGPGAEGSSCKNRNDAKELDTVAGLLSFDALVPEQGPSVLDTLTEKSHRHAVGVSKDLREGVRRSVELLANEVIEQRLARKLNVYDGGVDPRELTRQCLRFLYRLLFLLYAETRPELGVLPVRDDDYVSGYGLDRLRDLVLVDLTTETARNGSHIQASLDLLFRLVNDGWHEREAGTELAFVFDPDAADAVSAAEGLVFEPLHSDLFAPKATAYLDGVTLRNETLQEVLRLLFLSREQAGRDRGFVSYAQLGINQLGAVYEGLMAYRGFFADEDLFEVAKGGDPDEGTWVVPVAAADDYPDDVFVKETPADGGPRRRVRRPKGSFVFRLSGRDRQTSASYYTPEVLTRCVVRDALAELLDQGDTPTPARDILDLTICEPALGSGAFLNEAINQLASEYLERRQRELDDLLDPARYEVELQKVKAHIALHQCFGLDLNATALELAEVSLWLNCMHPGLQAPWFGMQLRHGNSLVGCRRATYKIDRLDKSAWLKAAPQDRPLANGPIGEKEIHHFLLPAYGWAAVTGAKQAKELRPDDVDRLRKWHRQVTKAPTKEQRRRLLGLAHRVEELWTLATERLRLARAGLRRRIGVWGADEDPSLGMQRRPEIEAVLADPGSPLGRLRLAMDAWTALWYRPLDPDTPPPSMDEWLDTLEGLLGRADVEDEEDLVGQLDLFADLDALADRERELAERTGERPVDEVVAAHPWLETVRDLRDSEAFWHWELEFAHVFRQGGFDLQVGNPPWVRLDWKDDIVLAELDPWFGITAKPPVKVFREHRAQTLADPAAEEAYLAELASHEGSVGILGSAVMRPVLKGVRTNLYMVFMDTVWRHAHAERGSVGLLQPVRHLVDPKAGALRRATYARLRRHFLFLNALLLFEGCRACQGVCVRA